MSNTSNQYQSTSSSGSFLPPPELRSLPLPPFPSPSPTLTTSFPIGTTAPLSTSLHPNPNSTSTATSSLQPPPRILTTPSPSTSLENLLSSESSQNNDFNGTTTPSRTDSTSPTKRAFPMHTTTQTPLPLPTSPSLAGKQAWTQQGAGEESTGGGTSKGDAVPKEGGKVKSSNPLEDLIRTENLYVQDLGVIIKKVAAAWSRANFPPPALDSMFRAIEAVYRINKSLLAKLNEIGPNPTSPKALGDLLMRWITEIEPSYTRYATTFQCDFDKFDPVQHNAALFDILQALDWPLTLPLPNNASTNSMDSSTPSTSTASSTSLASSSPKPTLDTLFTLPHSRSKYYKKLYAKLLKSTQVGRSDHDLLVSANKKLDKLLMRMEEAKGRSVLVVEGVGSTPALQPQGGSLEEDLAKLKMEGIGGSGLGRMGNGGNGRDSADSRFASSTASSDRLSGNSIPSVGTAASAPPRVEDLERRLCTDRALDIFTMLPKKCKLQMAPGNLSFARQIRRSADVVISFQPLSSVKHENIIRRAYIFLLTDLFLVCERMTPEERTSMIGPDGTGPDMWLLYPPLAGKHLRVVDGIYEAELEVSVMNKEKLIIKTESIEAAAVWKTAFEESIAFGSGQGQSLRSPTFSGGSFRGPPSPSSLAPQSFGNGSPTLGNDYRNDDFAPSPISHDNHDVGYGRPPPRANGGFGGQADGGRRAFSAGAMAPPLRKTSALLARGDFNSQPVSNSSSTTSLNGPPSGFAQHQENYLQPKQNGGFQPGQIVNSQAQSSYPNSFNNIPQPNGNFGYQNDPLPIPSHSVGLQRSASSLSLSDQSLHSTNFRPSGSYADSPLPPPAAGRYNQPTSRRTDPGSQQDLLSPGGSANGSIHRSRSADGLRQGHYRLPSTTMLLEGDRSSTSAPGSTYGDHQQFRQLGNPRNEYEDSPPPSPMDKQPEVTSVIAQMRCKAFLQQNHAQWKSLGTAKLKLFLSSPSGTKQLVVESDKSDKKVFVSTIVLTDGVERVGKTGVAIELSDRGSRTGIVYMLQMKNEVATVGLYSQLLLGSGRAVR